MFIRGSQGTRPRSSCGPRSGGLSRPPIPAFQGYTSRQALPSRVPRLPAPFPAPPPLVKTLPGSELRYQASLEDKVHCRPFPSLDSLSHFIVVTHWLLTSTPPGLLAVLCLPQPCRACTTIASAGGTGLGGPGARVRVGPSSALLTTPPWRLQSCPGGQFPRGLQGESPKPLMSPWMWDPQRRAWLCGGFEKAQKPFPRRLVASGSSSGRRSDLELYWWGGFFLLKVK